MQVIDDNTRLVIDRLTLTNLLFNLLDAQILVDPIPHVGVLKDGEIRRGINGKGLKVEGYKNPDLDWKEGQKVLYRIER